MDSSILTEKEQKVLAALYRLEDRSVSNLARETLINRTTLYPTLNRLINKGLVSRVSVENKIVFTPIPEIQFRQWLKKEEKVSRKIFKDTATWFNQEIRGNRKNLISEISYFEGHHGVENLYADTWRNNHEKSIRCITDYQAAINAMSSFFKNDYWSERIKHNIKVKNIMTDSKLARKDAKESSKYLRDLKFIQGLFENLGIEINVYDDKTAIIDYDEEKPMGVLIRNVKISNAMKNIFDILWRAK